MTMTVSVKQTGMGQILRVDLPADARVAWDWLEDNKIHNRDLVRASDRLRIRVNPANPFWDAAEREFYALQPRYEGRDAASFAPIPTTVEYDHDPMEMVALYDRIQARLAGPTSPLPAHRCGNHRDGCSAMVRVAGEYCRTCEHDRL
mgnify:FL=1